MTGMNERTLEINDRRDAALAVSADLTQRAHSFHGAGRIQVEKKSKTNFYCLGWHSQTYAVRKDGDKCSAWGFFVMHNLTPIISSILCSLAPKHSAITHRWQKLLRLCAAWSLGQFQQYE